MKRKIAYAVIAVVVIAIVSVAMRGTPLPVQVVVPKRMTVQAYVSEDAKTRLNYEYIVDMPVSGTLERIQLEVGDNVEKGQTIAEVDPYDLTQRAQQVEAQIKQ